MSDKDFDKMEDRDGKDFSRSDKGFGGRPRSRPFFKKKVCKICTGKVKVDYKDAVSLRKFVSDRGKILPRRITGTCAKHQRKVSQAVKRARVIAVLPFVSRQGS
ncbi:MAG: 30S ribosomal protein S18 [Spirochaetales bacterium]|nr:30S ribosomal protein S18 [Spirochaetales bacterium]